MVSDFHNQGYGKVFYGTELKALILPRASEIIVYLCIFHNWPLIFVVSKEFQIIKKEKLARQDGGSKQSPTTKAIEQQLCKSVIYSSHAVSLSESLHKVSVTDCCHDLFLELLFFELH